MQEHIPVFHRNKVLLVLLRICLKVNIFSFNVSPSDATVTLKDSNGQIVSKLNDKNTYINLKENEKYTYTVEKENYIAKTEEFTYTLENNLIDVALSYRPTKIVFNKTPQDAKITLYDNSNKVVEANEDGSYTLLPGEYKYYVEAEGYGPIVESFTVEEVNEDTTKEISVELEKAYNVTLKTDSTTDENITVYDKDKNVINPNEDNIYTLSAGTYSYEIVADGYENYSGSFEVVDKDIEIYNKLVKVYDLSWYDKDKTEFIINDKYELKGMAAILSGTSTVSKDDFAGKTIKLAKNIDLNSKDLFTTNENGTITVSEDKTLFTTISYDDGWSIYVDGKKVKTKKVLNAFLSCDIKRGTHDIKMIYYPKKMKEGLIVSMISLVIFIMYNIFLKKGKNKNMRKDEFIV